MTVGSCPLGRSRCVLQPEALCSCLCGLHTLLTPSRDSQSLWRVQQVKSPHCASCLIFTDCPSSRRLPVRRKSRNTRPQPPSARERTHQRRLRRATWHRPTSQATVRSPPWQTCDSGEGSRTPGPSLLFLSLAPLGVTVRPVTLSSPAPSAACCLLDKNVQDRKGP